MKMKVSIITAIGLVFIVLITGCGESDEKPPSFSGGYIETGPIERTLWKVLGKEFYTEFTDEELATITYLKVTDAGGVWLAQYELTLLARCINLTELELPVFVTIDLSPLTELHKLTKLTLGGVSDLSPLASLVHLIDLNLTQNKITDLRPLTGLVNLQRLNLQYNQIVDLKPLAGLVNLQRLNLQYNQIVDLKPLVENLGLSQDDTVMVERNPLNVVSRNEHIPALEARGVIVKW